MSEPVPYETEREQRIIQNKAVLERLGLAQSKATLDFKKIVV